jgi:hypothetical protein
MPLRGGGAGNARVNTDVVDATSLFAVIGRAGEDAVAGLQPEVLARFIGDNALRATVRLALESRRVWLGNR